ncbi:MAG: TRAP transporter fused permease subunit [Chloroflexota bacterium]|nr:TRAP transporter fused permease subunit [Chloroflexota bacterium]PLS79383.1 MAG: C4-dicarboxylate ABC transporter permease [Chloroflexota bacterium]
MAKAYDADTPELTSDSVEPISDEKVSQIIEEFESEAQTRQLGRTWRLIAGILAAGLSIYALYWTQFNTVPQVYRASFLMLVLVLTFLFYPMTKRDRKQVTVLDIGLSLLAIASLVFLIFNFEAALQRTINPTTAELWMGASLILLVLEATRRTTGWVLPLTVLLFLAYAYLGRQMPPPFTHRGQSISRIIGKNYLTLEGIFGGPLDVAATFIVLFTIYGAVLEYSGAGKFFLDWSFAALGKSRSGAGPGRTVTAAGFLLGTVSGSGVATTVTLGSLAWPMLKKAGYDRNTAGGILSAAGIGALLSPPTLGAAAFLIAEYLEISYLRVLIYATIPTALYYLSCLLMIEADSRRMNTHSVVVETMPLRELTWRYGYHFSSLFVIVVLMAIGMTPFMAVFWSIIVAFALSFLRPETRLTSFQALAAGVLLTAVLYLMTLLGAWQALGIRPLTFSVACFWGLMLTAAITLLLVLRRRFSRIDASETSAAGASATGVGTAGLTTTVGEENSRLLQALEAGGKGVISVAATTAAAGIIVAVVTLTGLGLKMTDIIVGASGGYLFLTILYAAIAVWVLGLAVPVTASYIIAAVMIVPALTKAGVNEAAAHMFIFYYAVLADVSPPTALAPFAAAALTGGNPFKTTMLAWKYCLPAFLVPFMITLSPEGTSLLMMGEPVTIAWTFVTACIAVSALAIAFAGYFIKQANMVERVLAGLAGLALLYADVRFDVAGLTLLAVCAAAHLLRVRRAATPLSV